jgi:hypothetical protein
MIVKSELEKLGFKVIEIMASSPKSWEDATLIAVKTAGETLKGIRSVYIHHMNALVKNNVITEFRVNAKITFEVLN